MTITTIQLFTFIIAVFIFIMTPGPGVFATIAKAMTQGSWAALPLIIGLAAGDTIYMVFSAYGLSALAIQKLFYSTSACYLAFFQSLA